MKKGVHLAPLPGEQDEQLRCFPQERRQYAEDNSDSHKRLIAGIAESTATTKTTGIQGNKGLAKPSFRNILLFCIQRCLPVIL